MIGQLGILMACTLLGQSGGSELTRDSTGAGAAATREARVTMATENFIVKVVVVGKTGSC